MFWLLTIKLFDTTELFVIFLKTNIKISWKLGSISTVNNCRCCLALKIGRWDLPYDKLSAQNPSQTIIWRKIWRNNQVTEYIVTVLRKIHEETSIVTISQWHIKVSMSITWWKQTFLWIWALQKTLFLFVRQSGFDISWLLGAGRLLPNGSVCSKKEIVKLFELPNV